MPGYEQGQASCSIAVCSPSLSKKARTLSDHYLHVHASQVPSATLSAEKLKKYTPEGGEAPMYVEEDVEDVKTCYNIGECVRIDVLIMTGSWIDRV